MVLGLGFLATHRTCSLLLLLERARLIVRTSAAPPMAWPETTSSRQCHVQMEKEGDVEA